jgi:hypothetical protein
MSHGVGPPPMFEGDDFSYWKIRMEAYPEAIDVGVYRATAQCNGTIQIIKSTSIKTITKVIKLSYFSSLTSVVQRNHEGFQTNQHIR